MDMLSRSLNVLAIELLLTWAALITACTDGDMIATASPITRSGDNRPPVVISAIIIDAPLSQAAPAAVQIQSEDPEREPVTYQYQWHVDDTPMSGQTSPTLPPEYFRRGQRVSVVVIPSDSAQKGQPYRTNAVAVGNTPPAISKVELQSGDGGSRIEAITEANDPDHDRIDLTYRWFQGEKVIQEGEESSLATKGLNTRLPIAVEVSARDHESTGKLLRSSPFKLDNRAPRIISLPTVAPGGDIYDYVVKAVDEDGDPITFWLEHGPPGMTIDENTGHLHWTIPADHVGAFHVKVLAKDRPGSIAYQEFNLTLSPEPQVVRSAA